MKTVLLGDVCEFKNGLWKGKKPPFVNVSVIRNTNFRPYGVIDHSDIAHLDVEERQFDARRLKYGDIILEKSGGGPKQPVGRVVFFDQSNGNYSFSNFTSVIRCKNEKDIEPRYLMRYLDFCYTSGKTEKMQNQSTGIRNLRFDDYKMISIPLPSIKEQRRIVKKLDGAFAAIDKAKQNSEKNLQNSQELFESEVSLIFSKLKTSADRKFLPDISKNLDSRRIPITKNLRKSGEVPYYGASGVVDYVQDYIFDENILLISEDGANLLARVTPIAFSVSGKAWVNNHAHVLGFENLVTQKFIELYLNSINLGDFITGTAQPKLNQTKLNEIPVFLPPLKTQEDTVTQLEMLKDKIQKMQENYRKKLEALEELRQSILKRAFEGKL